ncbi:EamA family transporter [Corynebacterium qintianiae]|uniref:EamA family transporter n=1 Tax=Corynebacterium qintianiae TaxID=2709392 RepID=UPI0013EC2F12|nr:EamA family transporter [Corynebacterium qintianiae]
MMVSGTSLYAGAAVAVGLFGAFPPALVAWFRISAAALLLLAFRRPHPRLFVGAAGRTAAIYGAATLAMNMTFYAAIALIPLGTAVAIEFLGPVAVAAVGSRTARDWAALGLATAGVLVISGATWSDNAAGILLALAAGVLWAAYIVAGSRIASDPGTSKSSTAVGFAWAAFLALPAAVWLWPGHPQVGVGSLALMWLGLGFFSAALPYSLDQVVMRLAGPAGFALLQAILPLVATAVGALALRQWLSPAEMIGVVLIVSAVALRKPAE